MRSLGSTSGEATHELMGRDVRGPVGEKGAGGTGWGPVVLDTTKADIKGRGKRRRREVYLSFNENLISTFFVFFVSLW